MSSATDRSPRFVTSEFNTGAKNNPSWDSLLGLQLCTEGLGSESSDNSMNDHHADDSKGGSGANGRMRNRSNASLRPFPPPISSIGRSGKLGVCFESYREDGRFVLRETKIPTQEFLYASREGGRLKLHFVHQDEEAEEEEE